MSNKRKFERYDLALAVSIKDKTGNQTMRSGNISRFGIFVITESPKPLRQLVKLRIEFPDPGKGKDGIDVLAQVMWVEAVGNPDKQPGMGLKFFSLPDEERRRWETFVDRVRSGEVAPEPEEPAANQNVYVIGEEELEELEDVDLDEEIIPIGDDEGASDATDETASGQMHTLDLSQELDDYEKHQPATSDDTLERRLFPRKPAAFSVRAPSQDAMRAWLTRDISQGGMFFHTTEEHPVGDALTIVVLHPWTGEELRLDAVVRREERNPDGSLKGLGVEFENVGGNAHDTILAYIECGFVIPRHDADEPIESEVIRHIQAIEAKIAQNPIDARLHYDVGLLYLFLSTWDQAFEHLDIAEKLGQPVPEEVKARLAGHAPDAPLL